MSDEAELRDKLRKIEALFAGAKTEGEKAAAGAAADRIAARLGELSRHEAPVEVRFAIHDPWSRMLFVALCRRYGLSPYRFKRMKRQSVLVRAPRSFMETTLWPEFEQLDSALRQYLGELTERIIREEVFRTTADAEEVPEPRKLE